MNGLYPPVPPEAQERAIRDAHRWFLFALKTEPLTLIQLARYLSLHRNLVSAWLAGEPGAEWFGRRVRVPLHRMPPAYFRDRGLRFLAGGGG